MGIMDVEKMKQMISDAFEREKQSYTTGLMAEEEVKKQLKKRRCKNESD